jgi:hypothetical protein
MGLLCSVALSQEWTPPAVVPVARRWRGAGEALLRLTRTEDERSCWWQPLRALASGQQDSLAPLLLTLILRQARFEGDLRLVREALEIALVYDLVDGPAPSQAAALLRRSKTLRL